VTAPVPARDRRRPLAFVQFRIPIEVEGVDLAVSRLEPGQPIAISGVVCPNVFFDPDLRTIVIGDSHYPMDGGLVRRMSFAKAAKGPAKQ